MAAYGEIIGALSEAGVPLRELRGPGCVAVTLSAARVIALAFTPDGPNLFWSDPQLGDVTGLRTHPERFTGACGGDRLWFAPEVDYHWQGSPQWDAFANYQVPSATDPGEYRFIDGPRDVVALHAQPELPVHANGKRVGIEIERRIRLTPPPLAQSDALMSGIDYVGFETAHHLRLKSETRVGRVDLWHLLQVDVGSVLLVPLKIDAPDDAKSPLSYGMPGAWRQGRDCLQWKYSGEARAKCGLPARVLTGRAGVLRELEPNYHTLIVREFSVDESATYGDHPHGMPRNDQVLQAWDGFGFGELEYHSPVLDAARGARELSESDRLWAFGGSPGAVAALAQRLLGIERVPDIR